MAITNPVTGLKAVPRYTQIDVSWNAEPEAPSYWVRANISGRQVKWETVCGGTSNFITLHNMDQGTTYEITCWAGLDGPGNHASVTTTTKGPKPGTSGMPTVTTTTPCGPPPPPPPPPGSGFMANPSAHGYPDQTNTGVTGVLQNVPGDISSGPGWTFNGNWVEVSGSGVTVANLRVPYNLDITGSNVTIRNCEVFSSGDSSFGISVRHTSGVTIDHCTIRGVDSAANRLMVGIKDIYADSSGLQVTGCNIYWVSTGVQCESGLIEGNFIHDMGMVSGDHINGTTSNGGGPLLTIQHNTIRNQISQTDCISLFEDFGAQHDRVIHDNLIAGGGYCIYGGQNAGGPTATNIAITGNRVSDMFFPAGGSFGWIAAINAGMNISGNIWDADGSALNP